MFKQRICDQYLQTWNTSVQAMPKLDYFNKFKTKFEYERYLDFISNDINRRNFTKFRLSAHNLEIEVGRYQARSCLQALQARAYTLFSEIEKIKMPKMQ